MAELIVHQEGAFGPSVEDNHAVINTEVLGFIEASFTKGFEDPNGGTYSTVILKSLPLPGLSLQGVAAKVEDSFEAINASNLQLTLPKSYAIHNGHMYRFYKDIDQIIADYELLGKKLLSNGSGLLVFADPVTRTDIVMVRGIEVRGTDLQFRFTTRSSTSGFDSEEAVFTIIPSSNVNIKENFVFPADGVDGKDAYEQAVENGFVGTVSEWLASLKGDKGDKGAIGPEGPAGQNGTSVTILGEKATTAELPTTGNQVGDGYIIDLNLWTWTGTEWILAGEIKGPQGNPGKSTYQIWLDQGHIGTEDDFLLWMKGEKGDKGDPGEKGDTVIGPPGPPGPPGQDGQDGADAQFMHREYPFTHDEVTNPDKLYSVPDSALVTDVYGKGARLERNNPDGTPDEWKIYSPTQIQVLIPVYTGDRITVVASTTKVVSDNEALTAQDITDALGHTPANEADMQASDASLQSQINAISGGEPTKILYWSLNWQSGYKYNPYFQWTENGVLDDDTREIILAPADATYDRQDLPGVNLTTDQVEILTGTPSANPEPPVYDPLTFLPIFPITVKAGSTEPEGMAGEVIYNGDDAGWTVGENAKWNTQSTNGNPTGTYCLEILEPLVLGAALQFTPDAPKVYQSGDEVAFDISNIEGKNFNLLFLGTASKNGRPTRAYAEVPSYSKTATGWQKLSVIVPSGFTDVTDIYLVAQEEGMMYYLDNMRYVSGGGAVPSGGVTYEEFNALEGRVEILEQNPGGGSSSIRRYLTIAAMLADQANQTDASVQYVSDASADPTVDAGYAYYEYKGTTAGTLADYRKLSEEESMDVDPGGLDVRMANLVSDLSTAEKDAIIFKLGLNSVTAPVPKSANFIVESAHYKKDIFCDSATAIIVTIPANDTTPIEVGFEAHFWQIGAGAVSFNPSTGVTLSFDDEELSEIAKQYNAVTLKKIAVDTWILIGALKKMT